MLHKDMRRAERRSRSHHVWMRRLRRDWADHGRQYSIFPVYDYTKGIAERTIIGWRDTLCGCFDLRNKQALRFKDTPSGNHRKRVCNGTDGDRINEYKDVRHLEVTREAFGTNKRLRKRLRLRKPIVEKVKCGCGFFLGRVMVWFGESKWSAISRNFGTKWPTCRDCKERLKVRMPA